nr:PREDICTED: UDP-glucuronosyltransferase 2B18-like [Bemisia tabaci]
MPNTKITVTSVLQISIDKSSEIVLSSMQRFSCFGKKLKDVAFYFHFFHGDYRPEATPVISSSIGASPNVQFRLGQMTMLSIISGKYGPVAVLIIILTCAAVTHSFKILILYPTPVFSHQRPMLALTERLIKDGHELYVVTPNPVLELKNHVNYTCADTSFAWEQREDDKNIASLYHREVSKWQVPKMPVAMLKVVRNQLQSQPFFDLKKHLESEKIKIDVVIAQFFLLPYLSPMARILAEDAPIVSLSTFLMDIFTEDYLGSKVHLSYLPSIFNHYTDKMNIWQKIENWFSHLYIQSSVETLITDSAREFFRDNYGRRGESLVDTWWEKVCLTLSISNSLYYYPRLMGPNVIETGPLHIKPPEQLPKNLQDWLDGAERGVIYFSFGSNMKSSALPPDVLQNFLKFFLELPPGYRVLWKWELDGKIPGQSDNILSQKWMPQHSVLAHPKVRLFITQGGLQSFQEAVHFGVPTLAIPWFVDQNCVAAKMIDLKVGNKLLPQDIHFFEKIKIGIETVLYDESYLKNMRRLSAISHDFTSQAMDKTVFWIEHVARHGGASHLRPATADASLFEYFCLDIISVILVSLFVILFALVYIFKFMNSYVSIKFGEKIKKA